jgi:hypothetical protein
MFRRGTALHGLHDLVAVAGPATRCGRERIPTTAESAIRARFVRDSFHRLSTEPITALSRRIVWYRRRRGCKSEQAHPGCSRRSRSTNGATERDVAWRAGTESYRPGRMNQADNGIRQRDCGHAVPPWRSGRGAGSRVAPCQMPWRARRCAMPGGRAKPVLRSCRFLPTRTASVADRCDPARSGGASLAIFANAADSRGSNNCNLDRLSHFWLE